VEINEYIESGILELYALNQLDPAGRLDVENMAGKYPEVARELNEIEKVFEQLAREGAIEPRAELKEKIGSSLVFSQEENLSKPPIQEIPGIKPEAKVVSLKTYILSLAASFILFILSALVILRLWNQLDEVKTKYLASLNENRKYASETRFIQDEYTKTLNAQADANNIALKLKGTPHYSGSVALVFWNKKMHKVSINPNSLPENDAQHSYQLWAIVNGKPVDEGTFEVQNGFASLSTMKERETAQAFAITLEPKGGSSSPHLDQLVAIASI
jgi:hypothetical protein